MEEHISPLRDNVRLGASSSSSTPQPQESMTTTANPPSHNNHNNNPHGTSTPDSTAAVAVASPPFSDNSSTSSSSPKQQAAGEKERHTAMEQQQQPQQQPSASSPFSAEGASPISKHSSSDHSQPSTTSCLVDPQQQAPTWDLSLALSQLPPPDKETLQSLHQHAMMLPPNNDDMNDKPNNNDNDLSDQVELSRYGVLSFPDVLLPAAAHQHNQVLRRLQAVAQRDGDDLRVQQAKAARVALYQATADARQAALDARHVRRGHWLPLLEQEQQAQLAVQQEHDEAQRQRRRAAQLQLERKRHTKNQEVWREVAWLMTEYPKLVKEEKVWKDALLQLEQTQTQLLQPLAQASMAPDEHAMDLDDDDDNEQPQQPATQAVMETVQDVTLACTRLQQSLEVVHTAMHATEALRQQVAAAHRASTTACTSSQSSWTARDLVRHMSQEPQE